MRLIVEKLYFIKKVGFSQIYGPYIVWATYLYNKQSSSLDAWEITLSNTDPEAVFENEKSVQRRAHEFPIIIISIIISIIIIVLFQIYLFINKLCTRYSIVYKHRTSYTIDQMHFVTKATVWFLYYYNQEWKTFVIFFFVFVYQCIKYRTRLIVIFANLVFILRL